MFFTTKCTGKSQASFSLLRQHSGRALMKPSCSLVTVNSRCPNWIMLVSSWMVSNPEFLISLYGNKTVISCLVTILSLGSRGKAFFFLFHLLPSVLGVSSLPSSRYMYWAKGKLKKPGNSSSVFLWVPRAVACLLPCFSF